MRGLWLIAPALLAILVSVVLPLTQVAFTAISNTTAPGLLPDTRLRLAEWQGQNFPSSATVEHFVQELAALDLRQRARLGSALEHEFSGFRVLLMRTARGLEQPSNAPALLRLTEIDPIWSEPGPWLALQRGVQSWTATHLLRTLDMAHDRTGVLSHVGPERAIFQAALARTIGLALLVSGLCLILAYPIAYGLSMLRGFWQACLMFCVLLPFWSSLLVRTSAWMILLQREGIINTLLQKVGLTEAPIQLIHNRIGLVITMVHILLPFMLLPLYSTMTGIPKQMAQAGLSLGAPPRMVFTRIYWPQTLPGIRTGLTFTFVLALGFYVTPALVGGPSDQLLSSYIAYYINDRLDWQTASALSLVLMGLVVSAMLILSILTRHHQASR